MDWDVNIWWLYWDVWLGDSLVIIYSSYESFRLCWNCCSCYWFIGYFVVIILEKFWRVFFDCRRLWKICRKVESIKEIWLDNIYNGGIRMRILVLCVNGLGISLMMMRSVEKVMKELNILIIKIYYCVILEGKSLVS